MAKKTANDSRIAGQHENFLPPSWIPYSCMLLGPYYNRNVELIYYYRHRGMEDADIARKIGISAEEMLQLSPPLDEETRAFLTAWNSEDHLPLMQEIVIKGDTVDHDARGFVEYLQGELGEPAYYAKSPYYAYCIGNIFVDCAGNLLVAPEHADSELLEKCIENKWIGKVGAVLCRNIIECCLGEYVDEDLSEGEEVEETVIRTLFFHDGTITLEEEWVPGNTMSIWFAFPISEHNGVTLRNLCRILYSKSELINKATGSIFHIDEGLIRRLRDESCTYATANFLHTLRTYEEKHGVALRGIRLTDDRVIVDGFPLPADTAQLGAFIQLAERIHRTAIKLRRALEKKTPMENEKYEMHMWITQLGMTGPEYKETRRILLKNLDGSSMGKARTTRERA